MKEIIICRDENDAQLALEEYNHTEYVFRVKKGDIDIVIECPWINLRLLASAIKVLEDTAQ